MNALSFFEESNRAETIYPNEVPYCPKHFPHGIGGSHNEDLNLHFLADGPKNACNSFQQMWQGFRFIMENENYEKYLSQFSSLYSDCRFAGFYSARML